MGFGLGMKIDEHGNAVPGATTAASSLSLPGGYGNDTEF